MLKGGRVAFVGEIIYDLYCYISKPDRCSREDLGAFCCRILKEEWNVGGIAVAARAVKNLGGEAEIYSIIGNDDTAKIVREKLTEEKFGGALITDSSRPTSRKMRVVETAEDSGRKGSHKIELEWHSKDQISKEMEKKLLKKIIKTSAEAIVVINFGRGMITDCLLEKISAFCKKTGKYLIVDGVRDFCELEYCTLMKANRQEVTSIFGHVDEDQFISFFKEAILPREPFLITLDKDGAILRGSKDERGIPTTRFFPAITRDVACVAGAGNVLSAVIALCLIKEMPLERACRIGLAAAAVTVGKTGSNVVENIEEIKCFLEKSLQSF